MNKKQKAVDNFNTIKSKTYFYFFNLDSPIFEKMRGMYLKLNTGF